MIHHVQDTTPYTVVGTAGMTNILTCGRWLPRIILTDDPPEVEGCYVPWPVIVVGKYGLCTSLIQLMQTIIGHFLSMAGKTYRKGGGCMMNTPTDQGTVWLTESAKAFIDALEGDNIIFSQDLLTIEEYESTLKDLRQKVDAQLGAIELTKGKYENLRKEFLKVCQERDSLAAAQTDANRLRAEINQLQARLKSRSKEIEDLKTEISKRDPRDPFKIVEDLYQAYRTLFAKYNYDTSRKKTLIKILVECEGAVMSQDFLRSSATNYEKSNVRTNLKH